MVDSTSTCSTDNSIYDIDFGFSDNSMLNDFSYIFYWNASKNPFDPKIEKKWTIYEEDDQKILNEGYEKYLEDKRNIICILRDYKIDFDKFIQFYKYDESRIRHVKMISSDLKTEISK